MTVRRFKDGFFMIDFRYETPTGRGRFRRICPVRGKRAAQDYEVRYRRELEEEAAHQREEVTTQPEVPTFEEFSREFMSTYVASNNKPSERMAKEYAFRLHLLPFFGPMRLDEITMRDVERFKAQCLARTDPRPIQPKTINNLLTVIGRMLRYACEVEIIGSVPRIKFMKVTTPKIDYLDFDELARLAEAARREPEAIAAILCAADAGLRAGEIRALQWDDIDLVKRQITVQRTDYRGHVGSPKGGRLRVVDMTDRLTRALKSIRHLKGPWVFSNGEGERWSRGEVDARLWRACRKAGLRKLGWHSLRHTFCSHLAMKGAPVRAIQELAGHASLTTTQRYMHLSPNARRAAIDMLETESFGQQSGQQKESAAPSAQSKRRN